MPKKILQDIITSSSSSERRIKINRNETKERNPEKSSVDVRMPSAFNKEDDIETNNSSTFSRFAIWGVAGVSVVFLLFVSLSFFSGTVVKIVPLQEKVVVGGDFSAKKDTTEENTLPFELIVFKDSLQGKVPTTKEKEVEKKAFGNIIIFNKYSSKSQKLRKRTRFETADGKVYRINKSVTVPGTTVEDGKIVPGNVEVTVYADIPGEEYNIGLTDFTIPGFKGDPRFNKFYARSKTPMKDGFSGTIKIASPEDIEKVEKESQNSLKETLLAQARSQVPEDFILYDDAVFFSFKKNDDINYGTKDSVEIKEEGTIYGILFNKKELSKNIAVNSITAYDGRDVFAKGLEDLKFSIINKEKFNPAKDRTVSFTLAGPVTIVWDVDTTSLPRDLAGIKKVDFLNMIDKKYPNIQYAKATLKPFWKKVFPENAEDITIKKIEPQKDNS